MTTFLIISSMAGWSIAVVWYLAWRRTLKGWDDALKTCRELVERIENRACCYDAKDDISVTITGIDECEETHGRN